MIDLRIVKVVPLGLLGKVGGTGRAIVAGLVRAGGGQVAKESHLPPPYLSRFIPGRGRKSALTHCVRDGIIRYAKIHLGEQNDTIPHQTLPHRRSRRMSN